MATVLFVVALDAWLFAWHDIDTVSCRRQSLMGYRERGV